MVLVFIVSVVLSLLVLGLPFLFKSLGAEIGQIESGFEVTSPTSTQPFSLNFFTILLIFIVFDLELFLLLPVLLKNNIKLNMFIILFIYSTLVLEWVAGKISWVS